MFQSATSLTFDNARQVTTDGLQAIGTGETSFDFSSLTTVDSSAVAVLLAWQRAARATGKTLSFTNVPGNLASLISLYDTAPLLGIPADAVSVDPARTDLPHH